MKKSIVYLTRSYNGCYDLLSKKPRQNQWKKYYGYDLGSKGFVKSFCGGDTKKYFGLKKHLERASKKVLKFELTLKGVKM